VERPISSNEEGFVEAGCLGAKRNPTQPLETVLDSSFLVAATLRWDSVADSGGRSNQKEEEKWMVELLVLREGLEYGSRP
jgi:hypothetical protein